MVTLSTSFDKILKSDRVPVYLGKMGLELKKGLQSSNVSTEIPNEYVDEQGNSRYRGISIDSPQISNSFDDLNVDLIMEQLAAGSLPTQGTFVPSASGTIAIHTSGASGGLVIFGIGPTDKITGACISYLHGGNVRIGEGAKAASVGSTSLVLSAVADNVNFAVGDQIIIQEDGSTVNADASTLATISSISGTTITYTGYNTSGLFGSGSYVYKYYDDPVTSTQFTSSGVPLKSLKGIEVFNFGNLDLAPSATSAVQIGRMPITAAGVSPSEIDSNDFRNNTFDVLLLHNDYDDYLMYSEYIQGCGITSSNYNGSNSGNATTSYEFNTGKGMIFRGYVNRRSMLVSSGATSFDLDALTGNVFKGSEALVTIPTRTTFNELSTAKSFLKVSTLDSSDVYKEWNEKGSASGLASTDYYASTTSGVTTVVFGTTVAAGTRIEFTYLCTASAVSSTDAYKFDADEFQRSGEPISINGKYQPVAINTTDFDSRVDGVESLTFGLTFSRDFYNAQGQSAQQIKPGEKGKIEGSLNTWKGYQKILRLFKDGTNDLLAADTIIDASDWANYTFDNDVPIRYRLYDPKDNVTMIKQMRIPKPQITANESSNAVGDDGSLSFSFIDKQGSVYFSR